MGDGIGGLILAPLMIALFDHYGYPGAMMILAGVALQCTVAGALYRPLCNNKPNKCIQLEQLTSQIHYVECKDAIMDVKQEIIVAENDQFSKMDNRGALIKIEVPRLNEEVLQECKDNLDSDYETDNTVEQNNHNESNESEINDTKQHMLTKSKWESIQTTLLKYFDVRLLAIPQFVCMAVIAGCVSASIGVSNMYLAGHTAERGLSTSQISTLLSVRAGTFSAAKLLSGLFFDSKFVRSRKVYVFPFLGFMQAFAILSIPLTNDLITVFITWLSVAFFTCWMVTQESGVVCDVVGLARFPSALGIARFIRGIIAFSGNVMGGKCLF